MGHHAVKGAYAQSLYLPIPDQDLYDLYGDEGWILPKAVNQGFDLYYSWEIAQEDPPWPEGLLGERDYPPGLGDVQDEPVYLAILYPLVDVLEPYGVVLRFPHVTLDVFEGPPDKLLPYFVGDHLAFSPHGPEEPKGEGSGAYPRLQDPSPGVDVAVKQDHGDVLGVNNLGVPGHVHDELAEGRPEGDETGAGGGPNGGAIFLAQDEIEGHLPFVEVYPSPGPEPISQLLFLLRVEEDDRLALSKGSPRHSPKRLSQGPKGCQS